MLLGVLGPIDVLDDGGGQIPTRGALPGRLLAALVFGGPSGVTVDQLTDVVWPSEGPRFGVVGRRGHRLVFPLPLKQVAQDVVDAPRSRRDSS